jgi:hypothetical protein
MDISSIMKIEKNTNYSFRFMLSSGDGDDYPGCKLNVILLGWGITCNMPPIIKPGIYKVRGQYNYDEFIECRYGVYLFDNYFNVCYGRGDANFHRDIFGEEQRWSCFLPWNEQRHVRHSLYGLHGEHLFSQFDRDKIPNRYDIFCEKEAEIPKVVFNLLDFDGEEVEATTHIEEREWHRGEKWFKWLSLFFKPLIHRSLDIQFNKETGAKKGSWKGGTIGHSIELKTGELHEAGVRRYCQKHNMTFSQRS